MNYFHLSKLIDTTDDHWNRRHETLIPKDFGVTDATFTDTSAGTTATITALLRNEYLEVEVEGEVGVESSAHFALARTSDVPNIAQGDTLLIGGTTYTVVEVQPDGEGITDLRQRTWLFFSNLFQDRLLGLFSDTWMIIGRNIFIEMTIKPFFPCANSWNGWGLLLKGSNIVFQLLFVAE